MPTRLIREGILFSDRVDQLTELAELCYRRLLSCVDDYGRFTADPRVVRSLAYPMRSDRITTIQITDWLRECANTKPPLIRLYTVAGKDYFEALDFRQQIRAKVSKYPDPPSDNQAGAEQLPRACSADAVQAIGPCSSDVAHARVPCDASEHLVGVGVGGGGGGGVGVGGGSARTPLPHQTINAPSVASPLNPSEFQQYASKWPGRVIEERDCREFVSYVRTDQDRLLFSQTFPLHVQVQAANKAAGRKLQDFRYFIRDEEWRKEPSVKGSASADIFTAAKTAAAGVAGMEGQ